MVVTTEVIVAIEALVTTRSMTTKTPELIVQHHLHDWGSDPSLSCLHSSKTNSAIWIVLCIVMKKKGRKPCIKSLPVYHWHGLKLLQEDKHPSFVKHPKS